MANMTVGGSTTGSISAGSVHDINVDVVEVPCTPVNVRKRKRRSFAESPEGPTDEVRAEIEGLLTYVPKIDKVFNITNKIGEGTFSSVYLAQVKCCGPKVKQQFALKHIIPTSHPERILGELRCLHMIGGKDNVMGMKLSLRERDHVVIVMPYFPHDSFHVFVRKMMLSEMREYMRNLLLALRRVHHFKVIHRDIKPSNFLCNRKLKKYALVDFGLAQKVPGSKCLLSSAPSRKTQRAKPNVQQKNPLPEKTSEIKRPQSIPRLTELDPNTFNRTIPKTQNTFNSSFLKNPKGTPLVKTFQQPTIMNQKRVVPKKQAQSATKQTQQRQGTTRLSSGSSSSVKTCNCFGILQVCNVCTSRSGQVAPRAGTPGFRSPEVLLKYPNQTTAVDIWAAGVIFLSILTGRYPFFKAQDDMTALAQIMSIVGTEEMKKASRAYGKEITSSVKLPAMNLKAMCVQLRSDNSKSYTPSSSDKKTRITTPTTNEKPNHKNKRRRITDSRTSCDNTPKTSPASSKPKARSTRSPPSRVEKVVPTTRPGCIPDSAYDLLQRLLDLNPNTRISAEEALKHPFISTVQ
ncbi:cell division cycle 7-related protein kinase-like [Asterias amurensis]|uniref:cell division cycle 7-related protein kinase-like n=1 Tax=Asterias amurensis TaxID=7602 RepID=UPI003AB40C8F